MTTQPSRRRRGQLSTGRQILLFGVLLAIIGAFYAVDRLVLNPWSVSIGGRPTLSGYWQGRIDLDRGGERQVVVELTYELDTGTAASGGGYDPLGGTLKVCGHQEARLFGDAKDRSGSRFSVDTIYEGTGPRDLVFDLRGEWAGDRIEMRARYSLQSSEMQRLHSDLTTGEVAFELRRTTKAAFEAGCPA